MKPLLRIWHFFRGHPMSQIYHLYEKGAVNDGEEAECEGCGKAGRRL